MEQDPDRTPRGMLADHWHEMNGYPGLSPEDRKTGYDKFRKLYEGNPYALEQIDIFEFCGFVNNLYSQTLSEPREGSSLAVSPNHPACEDGKLTVEDALPEPPQG